jgi:excisionase family DNA binding protein
MERRTFMSHREAADYLGVAEATLYTWVSEGRAPRSVRIGGRRKYKQADLDAWLKAAEVAEDERLAKIQGGRA